MWGEIARIVLLQNCAMGPMITFRNPPKPLGGYNEEVSEEGWFYDLADLNQSVDFVTRMFPLHPRKLTWNPKMKVWKIIFLFKGVIFRFHVSFLGSRWWQLKRFFFAKFSPRSLGLFHDPILNGPHAIFFKMAWW